MLLLPPSFSSTLHLLLVSSFRVCASSNPISFLSFSWTSTCRGRVFILLVRRAGGLITGWTRQGQSSVECPFESLRCPACIPRSRLLHDGAAFGTCFHPEVVERYCFLLLLVIQSLQIPLFLSIFFSSLPFFHLLTRPTSNPTIPSSSPHQLPIHSHPSCYYFPSSNSSCRS